MRYLPNNSILIAVMAAYVLCPSSAVAKADRPDLFSPAAAQSKSPQLSPEAVRSRRVNVDLPLLEKALPLHQMAFNFMGDQPFVGIVDEVTAKSSHHRTIRGKLDGIDNSSFTIVRYDEAVAGVFRIPGSQRLYKLRSAGKGTHLITEVDVTRYPPEACFSNLPQGKVAAPAPSTEEESQPAPAAGEKGAAPETACAELPTVLDVMLVYTPAARQAMGGTHAAAIAECQLAIEVANQAYDNSLIIPRLRLVHCTEVAYTETNDMNTDLSWLTNPYTATQVHADRNTYGADFVSMILSYGTGLGWCGGGAGSAFSVVKWDRAANTWSLAHEIGHNQGCDHNREDAGCSGESYAYGYYFIGNSGTQWGTVMSYLGKRVDHFSNHNVLHDGQPTGIANGETGEAYNVKVIDEGASSHEDYRLTRYDLWLDFNWNCFLYGCDGTLYHPYATLANAIAAVPVGENPSDLPNLWIKSSTSNETVTISKQVTLRACSGLVTIGATP